MQEDPIKICSKCGEEYSMEAQVCAECGGKLVFEQEYEKRLVPLTETDQMVCVREDKVGYLEELSAQMKKSGIRTVITLHDGACGAGACQTRYGLYVAQEDEAAAKDIIKKHWLKDAPEDVSTYEYAEQELKGVCPACSTTIPEDAAECPECGLVVKATEEVFVCPTCDAEVGENDKTCPKCAEKFM